MIELRKVSKKYGDRYAIRDVSFSVERGSICGFLGPNGAGKSTTMNIMAGCLSATEGEAVIGGHSVLGAPMQTKRLVGYLPEIPPLYPDMTPREYLLFVARSRRIPRAAREGAISLAMERAGIRDMGDRLIRNLSKGYRQRVGISEAILGEPEVIILDEPTAGLDPAQIVEIRDLIRSLGGQHTVMLSSHILSEISAVCDQVIIISGGHIVADDEAETLLRRSGRRELDMRLFSDEQSVRASLGGVPGIEDLRVTGDAGGVCRVLADCTREDTAQAVAFAVRDAGLPVFEMSVRQISLEDIFLELTAGEDAGKTEVESL